MAEIVIADRFCGPPDSGNGGYVAGVVASALGGSDCTVTLKRPPPLNRQLELAADGASAVLRDDDGDIATGVGAEVEMDVPPPPTMAEAVAAEALFPGLTDHLYPACFVCGPLRPTGDGLRIFPGPTGPGQIASTWRPTPDLCGEDDLVRREFVWAALDCPGYFAVQAEAGDALLGRMSAKVLHDLRPGEAAIVTGWAIANEGRKHHVGTALHDWQGRLLACARSTWVTLAR